MNPITMLRIRRVRSLLIASGVLALLVAAVLAWFWPRAILPAYRFAGFVCFGPAVGSMLFLLIHRITGGQWGDTLAPYLNTGARFAPWLWLLILPNLFFVPNPSSRDANYDSRAQLAIRCTIYAVIFFGTALLLARARVGKRRASVQVASEAAWVGPVGLIVLVFTLHLLADDWLAGLGSRWHSTAFPLVWMTGQAVMGFGCAVLMALACGASPRISAGVSRAIGLDWGNVLLAAMLVWCYVAFAQFLIIWAGNLPREISPFVERARGAWRFVPAALAVLHFFVPFAILLSRNFKRSVPSLAGVSALLVFAQLIYLAWLILPTFPGMNAAGAAVGIALGFAALAFFLERYLIIGAARAGTI